MVIAQYVDTGDTDINGTCRIFLLQRDGGVHTLECRNATFDSRLNQVRAGHPTRFIVYRLQVAPCSQRVRNSTGVDGDVLTAQMVRTMERAEFNRLARRTGYEVEY
jgi:hypothetical protein